MLENPATAAALATIFVVLMGSGIGVSFFLGRRTMRAPQTIPDDDECHLPDRVVKELIRCLELGDYVVRDADTLTAIIASQPNGTSRPVSTAMQQLVKTAKSLVGRLNKVGAAARVARPSSGTRAVSLPAGATDSDGHSHGSGPLPASRCSPTSTAAPSARISELEDDADKASSDARRFPRSSFRGTAWATIYPQNACPGREPLRCEVLTRDLSCGGIGIAHAEPLFPKQIIVLDALGKLLVSEVRWCRRVDENFYVAGCRLVKTGG